MTVTVRKWGNSLGIRIPSQAQSALGIAADDDLVMEINGDKIILQKVYKHKTFKQRLEEYGNELSTLDFDWGEPQGRELL